jgi:hypothetical protein
MRAGALREVGNVGQALTGDDTWAMLDVVVDTRR